MFPINDLARHQKWLHLTFKAVSQFKYLGIVITNTYTNLFNENFGNLLERATQDLQRWVNLSLSLAGRVNIIKMTILPKFIFLFQCIPFLIKNGYFYSIDGIVSNFIWNNKLPRVKKAFLQRPRAMGGMGLPDFKQYYWACNKVLTALDATSDSNLVRNRKGIMLALFSASTITILSSRMQFKIPEKPGSITHTESLV